MSEDTQASFPVASTIFNSPVVDIHDRVADAYYGKMGQQFMRETQARIHWICNNTQGRNVLDIGCSQGIVPMLLAREGMSVIGVDTSPTAIEEATQLVANEPRHVQKKITFVNADFLSHDFKSLKIETVIMSEVLEHLVQPQLFVDAAAKLLPNNGQLIITVPFGINDFIDHKHTFYLLEPYQLIARYFDVKEVKVLGKWLGIVALRREKILIDNLHISLSEKQIAQLEAAFLKIERKLRDELVLVRNKLDDANQKYRVVSEQITTQKHRITQEESIRVTAEGKLQQVNLNLAQVQSRLDEANQKYRDATEQVSALKQRVAQEETTRLSTVKALEQTQAELATNKAQLESARTSIQGQMTQLQQKIERLQLLEQTNSAAAHETEKQLIGLQGKYESTRDRLEEANQKYRDATEQVSALKQRVAQEETTRLSTVKALEQTQAELATNKAQLESARTSIQGQMTQLQQKIERLQLLEQTNSAAAHETEKQLIGLQGKYESTRDRLEEANQKYRDATEQVSALKQRVAQESKARLLAEQASDQVSTQLEQANLKYRKVTAEDIPNLKAKLEEHYSIKREQQHLIEQLKLKATNDKNALSEVNQKLRRLQQQKMAADQQVIKTRASLSFQLGYLLMQSVKSVNGMLGLPSALWTWRKELKKRQQKKNHQQKLFQADTALATPQSAAKIAPPDLQIRQETLAAVQTAEKLTPEFKQPVLKVRDLRQIKVACIMDEFTFGSYQHECIAQQLTPEFWKKELETFQPELLFIESAWRGKDELWGSKVGHASQELQGIVAWCRTLNVPTVFWNKEDPVHFETFLTTAKLFDYVFTTDIDCIHRYKAALGHERVYILPFACQPANNNPIETYDRKDTFCFAGAYYVKYPERTRDLGNFVAELPTFRPLEIYDRNFGKNDINYQFPPEYQPYIVGTLPFDQIDKAYKGYRYAINLNSIKQSQSMFARRVFELLASNTITVSNYSRGVRLLFGDLVITTDSGSEVVRHLNKVASDEAHSRKLRLAALRKVLEEHTYAQRMAYVVSKLTKQAPQSTLPHITVVALAVSQAELDYVLQHYQRQRYAHSNLIVILATDVVPLQPNVNSNIRYVTTSEIGSQTIGDVAGGAHLIAGMVTEDYYGSNYLTDIGLATCYSDADVIGKAAHFTLIDGLPTLQDANAAYRPANNLSARCAATRLTKIADATLIDWLASLKTLQLTSDNGLAIDEFNYCHDGADLAIREVISTSVDDLQGLNTGISIDELLMRAERIAPESTGQDESPVLTGKQFAIDFDKLPSAAIKLNVEYDHWRIDSTLPDAKHEYLYATADYSLNELGADEKFKFYLEITPGLNVQLVILFLDAQKQKISHVIKPANRNQEVDIPLGTESIRFGLRFYASGSAEIMGLVLGHRNMQPAEIISQVEHLVLTNHYPSYDDLYRNGFVHSRVRAYREHGIRCDVFKLRPNEALSYYEFEDVDVTIGSQEVLHKMLCSGQYKSVLVHFLDPSMWEVLQHHIDTIKVVVWVHGAEIQPWHRRDFNYQTEEDRTVAKMKSEARMVFWRELLQPIHDNLKLVFVSRYFVEEVMEDLGFRIPENNYNVIHNPINTKLFSYHKKSKKQRKKILSIRPYASRVYANDLSVQTIQLLSSKPYFYDMEFRMIGDGPLFEETLAPLREFRNVYIEQRFLKQNEIAELHKEYGIFLCPSRMDTQGVSRDEAMASGLVPVTNVVAAIPEFVDDSCGVLAAGENAEEMAEGIERLYNDPTLFITMSVAAAQRVRNQSSNELIIEREIMLIDNTRMVK